METLARFNDVKSICIHDYIPQPEGQEEARILLQAVKNFGEWDAVTGEGGRVLISKQGYSGNFVELEFDAVIRFKGLDIMEVGRSGHCLCVHFFGPTDIAIIDTEELVMSPLDPEKPPRAEVLISALANLEAPLHADPWANKSVREC
jgi:hypothetical protein